MFIFTFRHFQVARPHRLLSLRLPSAPIRHTQPYLETRSTRSFITASVMPKRKRAAAAPAVSTISPLAVVANTGVSTNASVLEEQTDEYFDCPDAESAGAAPLDSSELSSPPASDQGAGCRFTPELEIAIPVSKKKAGGGKKTPIASKRKSKVEGGVEIAGEHVGLDENGAAKKTTTGRKNLQAKKRKADENDEGMESELEKPEERPPPVNSDYVPIPWKGRLGFVSLSILFFLCNSNVFAGLFEHLSTVLESTDLLLPNMPHRYDTQAWHRRSEIRRVPGPSKRP